MKIAIKSGKPEIETDDMTIEEIQNLLDAIDRDRLAIKRQIEDAKTEYHETGEYADSRWYSKASFALKFKNKQWDRLNRERAARERAEVARIPMALGDTHVPRRSYEKAVRQKIMGDLFMSVLKEKSPEVFRQIMNTVKIELAGQIKAAEQLGETPEGTE